MLSGIDLVERNARRALIPPPRLALSDWIEANMRLPESVSALPGPIHLTTPQRGIADAISDPEIERVTLVKPVRLGLSTLLTATVGSYVQNEPSPILLLLPTESDCRDYVVSDLEPIFDGSPALAGLLSSDTAEGERNTLLSKRFPGGSLKIVASKSPRNLRRHNVRILLIDEADAMEPGAEGSPVTLAERRTLSFANRKIILGSTPTFEDTSNVLRAYRQSDMRVFEVRCPSCGEHQEINWRNIQWDEEKPETAHFVCDANGCIVEERHKAEMVERGRWRAKRPEVKGHAGFRCNVLISTLANASWGKVAAEFLAAKSDPDQLQTWTNTLMAEGWREGGDELDDTELASRAEPFGLKAIPEEVLAVTAGVDVQQDRLECTMVGWDRDGMVYVLAHYVVWGDPHDNTTWIELDELLKTRWEHPLGGRIGIDAVVVDSSDGSTMRKVYEFAFPRSRRKILAGKGMAGNRLPLVASKSKTAGGRLWLVGVDGVKTNIMNRLTSGGSIRFSSNLDPSWFEQLASERLVIRYSRGQPQRRFERIPGRRAEALDCLVYAMAARHVLNINYEIREDELRRGVEPQEKRLNAVNKSNWMQRK